MIGNNANPSILKSVLERFVGGLSALLMCAGATSGTINSARLITYCFMFVFCIESAVTRTEKNVQAR